MNKKSEIVKTEENEAAIIHVQKTVRLIDELHDASSIRMLTHTDGGKYLLLENGNILHAKKAFYHSRSGKLMVNGFDEKGDLYLDGLPLQILCAELPINARDALISRAALSVSDVTLANYGKGTAEPYTIDCQIIDPDTYVDELTFFPESYDGEEFKYGVRLSDGTKGEIIVKITENSRHLTFDEIASVTWSHKTVSASNSNQVSQILYEQTTIKIGGFEIKLSDDDFIALASSNSITRSL